MNRRERILAIVLGVVLLGGVAYASVAFMISPVIEKGRALSNVKSEIAGLENSVSALESKNRRLQTEVYKRSLPAELPVAKQEYSSTISRLLREAKVPPGYSFGEHAPNLQNVPQIAKGKPFYQKIGYQIKMPKVDVGTLMVFLKKFHEMNLLHQVTQFSVKRSGTATIAADSRQPDRRTDLEVMLTIEAIIVDGVPPRKTLYAAPTGTGAVMGGMGIYSLENTPEVARGITPAEITRVLAVPNRIYADVVTRDVFHGYVPPPEPPPPPKKDDPIPEPPRKPDLSAFVKFNSMIGTSDGHTLVELYDQEANAYYAIDIVTIGEKQTVKAQKFSLKSEGRIVDKSHPAENWLEINNAGSRANRKFWVYGMDGNALILGDRDSAAPEPVKAAPKIFGKNPKAVGTTLPVADPKAAILGGIVAIGPKPERYFRWGVGQTMNKVTELTKAEVDPIIRRIQGVSPALEKPAVKPVIETPKELAPMPRGVEPPVEDPGK